MLCLELPLPHRCDAPQSHLPLILIRTLLVFIYSISGDPIVVIELMTGVCLFNSQIVHINEEFSI